MQVSIIHQGKVTLIGLQGGFDALTAPTFTQAVDEVIQQNHLWLVIDLSQVDYVGSAGVRALLKVMKDTRQKNGDVVIASVPTAVYQVFEMTGLPSIIKFYATTDDALAKLAN